MTQERGSLRLTYRFRIRDKHCAELDRQARAVNFVWNYCNETQQKALAEGALALSAQGVVKQEAQRPIAKLEASK